MAYPQYYPNYMYQPQNFPTQQQAYQASQPQIQNGGFISVRSEDEARNYPVAPGTSVTFIDESRQRVYSKTMGFSQLDRPIFDKYKLVKEDETEGANMAQKEPVKADADILSAYALKADIEPLTAQIEELKKEVDALKEQISKKPAPKAKKEGDEA